MNALMICIFLLGPVAMLAPVLLLMIFARDRGSEAQGT